MFLHLREEGMNNNPIGVFDSGLGGLNVLKELRKVMPNENFIYLGDTKRFPYGQKSASTIIDIAKQNVEFLIGKNVKLIVIACGTVTSQALDYLTQIYEIPIIGIIEPTVLNLKERIDKFDNTIGVIATKGTIRSRAWEKAISKYIPNAEIISQPAPLLATMAEEGWINNKVAEYTIKEYMKLFKNVDKLILGCTHYPLFADLMKAELDDRVEIVDTGKELAIYLGQFLKKNSLQADDLNGQYKIYLTDKEENFAIIATSILNENIDLKKIEKFEI